VFRFQETIKVPPWAFLVSRNETCGLRAPFLLPWTWIPGYFFSISFLRGAPQVGSAGSEKRQLANFCTEAPCICTRTPRRIKILAIAPTKLWSGLTLSTISWGSSTFGGGMETRNLGVSFPPGKQKEAARLPGPFHEKRNNPIELFSRFLVHSGAPKKQSLKSPCFVPSDFSCFNFFPTYRFTWSTKKYVLSTTVLQYTVVST
jgi:hypothetical protein